MALPILYAETPLSVPATTFDKVWIELIEITAPSPDEDATARVRLRRFQTANGVSELERGSAMLVVENIIANSETDPDLAAAVNALMAYVAKKGIAEGVIAPPEA